MRTFLLTLALSGALILQVGTLRTHKLFLYYAEILIKVQGSKNPNSSTGAAARLVSCATLTSHSAGHQLHVVRIRNN